MYATKSTQHRSAASPKRGEFFVASLLIETVYCSVAWISNQHYAYPVFERKKRAKKQYTAAFLLIFIILLDLFLASWMRRTRFKNGKGR
jgi:hypothetical protein